MEWTEQFRQTTLNDNDIVAFDLLGGDFNLDNMSPGIRDHTATRCEGRHVGNSLAMQSLSDIVNWLGRHS